MWFALLFLCSQYRHKGVPDPLGRILNNTVNTLVSRLSHLVVPVHKLPIAAVALCKMLVLFETAAGYALFKLQDKKKLQ